MLWEVGSQDREREWERDKERKFLVEWQCEVHDGYESISRNVTEMNSPRNDEEEEEEEENTWNEWKMHRSEMQKQNEPSHSKY